MRSARICTVLAVLQLTACATGVGAGAVRPERLAPATRDNAGNFVVLAVANEPDRISAHPGSTARSYGSGSDYVVSDGARRAMRALAAEYQLQPVAAWPIGLLHLQCAVLASRPE